MSSLVSESNLPRFFWFALGVGVECCMHSSDSGVMCSAQMRTAGSVLLLLNSEMSSRPLISAMLRAAAISRSCVSRCMGWMGGGPNSVHWAKP